MRVPPDFLANVVAPLRDPGTGLVNCFYRLANPATTAMRCEAIAINADFWSQVLQSASLKPLAFHSAPGRGQPEPLAPRSPRVSKLEFQPPALVPETWGMFPQS